jgi:hypothetical protein
MLWRPGTQSKSARLSLVGNEVILARCERVVMARLEAPLGATNALIEPSQKCFRDGVFIARTLVRARPRVLVRIMNATNQDQVLSEGTTVGHGQPAVWAATIGDQKPEPQWKQGRCKQRGDGRRVRRFATAAANGWDRKALRKEVLAERHGVISRGHLGTNNAIYKVRQHHYWWHLRGDIERGCQQCDTCAIRLGPRTGTRG